MQSITISNHLHVFLQAKTVKVGKKDINDFLSFHFGVKPPGESNPDTSLRDLLSDGCFRLTLELHKRYVLFLQTLWRANGPSFGRLNNFAWPLSGNRIVLSSTPRAMHAPHTLSDSGYFYCLGFGEREYRDLVFHITDKLLYPLPMRQEVRQAFTNERAHQDFLDEMKDI